MLALLLLAGIAGYAFLTTETFQVMARARAVDWFQSRFRARLSIGQLEWLPFSNSLTVREVAIHDPGSADPQAAISFREAVVDFSLLSLFSRPFDLQEVRLSGLIVRVRREADDRINLARAFDRLDQPAPPPNREFDIGPFINLAIDRVRAIESQILYFDQPISVDSLESSLAFKLDWVPTRQSYLGDLHFRGLKLGIASKELPATDLEMQFQLEKTRMLLDRISLRSPWIEGQMNGVIDGYQTLDHRVEVDLSVDSQVLGQTFPMGRPLEGRIHVTGTARGRRRDYGLVGQARGDLIRIGDFDIQNYRIGFRLDQSGSDLTGMTGLYEGVPFQGQGTISWSTDQESSFQGEAGPVSRHPVAGFLRPYATLLPSGRLEGGIRFPGLSFSDWKGSGKLRLPGVLEAAPPAPAAPGFRIVSNWAGDASGFRFANCLIEMDQTEIGCEGTFKNPEDYSIQLHYQSVSSSEIVSWARAQFPFPDPRPEGRIWGEAILAGQVGPTFSLQSQTTFEELRYQDLSLGGVQVALRNEADGSWNAEMEADGQGRLSGKASARFDRGDQPLRSAEGRLSSQLGPLLDQYLDLAESRAPADLEFSLERGLDGALSGPLKLQGTDWKVAGQSLASVRAEAQFQAQQIKVGVLQLEIPGGGVLRVGGDLDLSRKSYDLRVEGRELDLSRVTLFDRALPLTGTMDLKGSASGDQWPPDFSFQMSSDLLQAGGQTAHAVVLSADHSAGLPESRVSGTLRFLDQPFSFSGSLGLASPFSYSISSDVSDFPVALLFQLSPLAQQTDFPEITGSVEGRVELQGELESLNLSQAKAVLSRLVLKSADLELQNQLPLQITLREGRVDIQEVTFEGADSTLTLQGSVVLGDDPELNIRARGNAGLALLNPFLENVRALGRADVQLLLGGKVSQPQMVGEVNITDAAIQNPAWPVRLTRVRSRLRFTADQIAVEDFQATTPYGLLQAQGGVFLDGFTPSRWLLRISGEDLRLNYPQDLLSIADVELDLARSDGLPLLSGVVHVRSADYQQDLSLSDLVLRYGQLNPIPSAALESNLALNITINAYRAIRIDNNLGKIEASGELKLRGTLQNPVLQGSLMVDEGQLFLERNEYRVTRGGVTFNDPRQTRPVLNFEAETQVQDYDISVVVSGPLDRLNASFRSDPPLPTPNIVSLLALGQTGDDLFRGSADQRAGSLAVYGAGALLNQSLNERLQKRSNRLFALDRISIDPFLSGAERNPGARVTLGKHLGNRLSVTYSTDLGSQYQGQIVVIQWKLTDWLTAVGTGEQNGALAVDFKLRRRF